MLMLLLAGAAASTVSAPALPKPMMVCWDGQKVVEAALCDPVSAVPDVLRLQLADGSVPAIPNGNPGNWVTTNDYPVKALREKRQGITGFTVKVDKSGIVSDCTVTAPSGSEDLDIATCDLIKLRARFTPAKDKNGIAIDGIYVTRVRWQIPEGPAENYDVAAFKTPLPKEGQFTMSFTSGVDGKAVKCRMESTYSDAKNDHPCAAKMSFQPYHNAKGDAVAVRVIVSQVVKVIPQEENGGKAAKPK